MNYDGNNALEPTVAQELARIERLIGQNHELVLRVCTTTEDLANALVELVGAAKQVAAIGEKNWHTLDAAIAKGEAALKQMRRNLR